MNINTQLNQTQLCVIKVCFEILPLARFGSKKTTENGHMECLTPPVLEGWALQGLPQVLVCMHKCTHIYNLGNMYEFPN